MNHVVRCCFVLLINSITHAYAQPLDVNNNYWQCTTHDAVNKEWTANSAYQKIALNYAFALCKRESTSPETCKTSSGNCEQFIQGISVRPMWQCTALDFKAVPWRSNNYSQRIDAALAAKDYCRQNSTVPGTCYINLVTCVNRNGVGI